jgi:hypothetical protein
MKIYIPLGFWAFFLVALLHWSGAAVSAAEGLSMEFKVGHPFPAITLPSLEDGRPSSIAQFRGQKLILHIFASW